MLAKNINKGDLLLLKSDNPYGITELGIEVAELKFKQGYETPWVMDTEGRAFRPSDLAGPDKAASLARANARIVSAGRKKNYA